tara:strand:- start:478 stop:1029 length:552 start_codon:yes stop_codon:yes gene_type:complete
MARSISSGLQTQIANDANNIAFLVELNFSTPIRVTNFYRDVTYDSNAYEAGGNFLNVAASQETGEAAVQDLQITMSNVTSTIRTVIEGGDYIDKSVNVYIAFFDTNETLVDATTFFSGLISSCSISETIDSSAVTINVANHWANWNLKKGRHFTDESQQQVYSGDKGLEYADQTKDDIRWGNS